MVQAYLSSGSVPARQGNAHLQIVPYQLFATADGWLVLAVGNDGQWQHFCRAADRLDLAEDDRFKTNAQRVEQRDTLVPVIEALMRSRPTREWERLLVAAGVPHAPVQDYAELFAQPQGSARGWRVSVTDPAGRPVDLVGSPFHISGTELPPPRMPPALGQDSDAVLGDLLGLDAARLVELRQKGIV